MNLKMRKINSFLVAAVTMFAAVSCAKEIVQDNQQAEMPSKDAMTFVASVDGADAVSGSKSVLDGQVSYWKGEEKIWILDPREETNDEGTFLNTAWKKGFNANVTNPSLTATFEEDNSDAVLTGESYMALYPAGPASSALWEGGDFPVTGMWLSNKQTAVAGSYDPSVHIAVAQASSSSNLLSFKNVSSLIKFNVEGKSITEVKFISYGSDSIEAPKVSGNFSVDYNGGNPTVTPETEKMTSNEVVLEGDFEQGPDYFMAILPVDLAYGFGVEINGYKVKELSGDKLAEENIAPLLNRERNKILNLGKLALNFGICGTHTNWETDTPMNYDEAEGLYVAENVAFDAEGDNEFKIRVNGAWLSSLGNGDNITINAKNQVYSDGGNSKIAAGTYDIWFDAGKKIVYAMEDGKKPSDIDIPEWAIAGTFNDWSTTATPMVPEGDYYVARNVTGLNFTAQDGKEESETGFKFVHNGADWKGTGENGGVMTVGSWAYIWGDNGLNICINGVLAETAYDIYLNPSQGDHGKFVIVAAGDPMPEDVPAEEPEEVVVDYWAVIGTMTDNWASEIQMALDGDWYVAENVKIMATDQFKFRANGSWDDPHPNRGAEGNEDGVVIENEVEKTLVAGGKNLSVAENGYYSLYINKAATKAKVVKTGDVEVEPEPVYPEWSIAGSLNSWSSTATPMALEGDYYVAKNVEFASAGEFKIVNNGTTWYNAEGTFSLGKWGTIIANDGSNISIAAGKYDFYLTGVNLYVVAAGSNAPLAPGVIPAEDGWVYLKPNSNWTQANARFAIYFFGAGETWISMTKIEGTSYYGAKISDMVSKGYKNLIFCRMNPSGTANNWNNKWDQTADLEMSDFTKGNNCFSLPSGSWSGATKTWSHIDRLN